MRYRSRIIATLLLPVMILSLTGCFTEKTGTLPAPDAYTSAVAALTGSDFSITAITMQQTQKQEDVIQETSTATVFYTNYGKRNMTVSSEKSISIGQNTVSVREYYADGTAYLQVNEGFFSASLTQEQAQARYIPTGILSPNIYKSTHMQTTDSRQQIGFTQPTQAETWVMPDDAQLVDASGTAVLLSNGTLAESSYSLSYIYGTATVTYSVITTFDFDSDPAHSKPEDTEHYVPVSQIDAPLQLETACARLLQVSDISATSVYNVLCEAGGLQRMQNTQTKLTEINDTFTAQVNILVELTNLSQQGTVSTYKQEETFTNGTYSIVSENGADIPSGSVTEEQMRSYCKNNLVCSVVLPQYITDTQYDQTNETYQLTFSASADFAELLFNNAYQILYTDTVASDAGRSYKTDTVFGYIEISKFTGLPLRSGLSYSGTNTIDEASHKFTVSIEQEYEY